MCFLGFFFFKVVCLIIFEKQKADVKIFILSYESKGKADTSGNSAVLKLAKGDEVWLRMGNGALHGDHQRFSTFAGFLLFETK